MTTVSTPNPAAELPLEDLLEMIREKGWTLHLFGSRESPDLYAATFKWPTHTDVVLLRDESSASAHRVAARSGVDVLAPRSVTWQYHSSPTWTLRAALALAPPFSPNAPRGAEPAHALCVVPPEFRQQQIVRRTGLNQPPGWSWF